MTLLVCVPTIFDFQLSVGENEVVRWNPQAPIFLEIKQCEAIGAYTQKHSPISRQRESTPLK